MYLRRRRKKRLTIIRFLLACLLVVWVGLTIRGFEQSNNLVNYTYELDLD